MQGYRAASRVRAGVTRALKTARRNQYFTVGVALTLAFGVGSAASAYRVASWIAFRPLQGVEEPAALRLVWSGVRDGRTRFSPRRVSYLNYRDVVGKLSTVSVAGVQRGAFAMQAPNGMARMANIRFVTPEYFGVLGIRPVAGRVIGVEDDSPSQVSPVAVISHELWRRGFDRSPDIVGKRLDLNGVPLVVVGVMSHEFIGTDRAEAVDVWLPGSLSPTLNRLEIAPDDRTDGGYFEFIARPKAGYTWDQAEAELVAISAWLASHYPKENEKFKTASLHVMGSPGSNPLSDRTSRLGWMLLGLGGLVLVISCANVANLQAVRSIERGDEYATRRALGASTWDLVTLSLADAGVVWCLAGLGGLLLSLAAERFLMIGPLASVGGLERGAYFFGLILGLTVVTGILTHLGSLVSIWRTRHVAAHSRQRSIVSARSGNRVGVILSSVQLAASLALIVLSLTLALSARQLARIPIGFEATGLWAVPVSNSSTAATTDTIYREVLSFLGEPAANTAMADKAPFVSSRSRVSLVAEGGDGAARDAVVVQVATSNYFQVLGLKVTSGRSFTSTDLRISPQATRAAIAINQRLARDIFGRVDVVGQLVRYAGASSQAMVGEVIGVVADARFHSLRDEPDPAIYEPAGFRKQPPTDSLVLVRSSQNLLTREHSSAAVSPARSISGPIVSVGSIVQARREDLNALTAATLAVAVMSIVIATAGVYGVVARGVANRRREFAVRLALGASNASIRRIVSAQVIVMCAIGIGCGSVVSYALKGTIQAQLSGLADVGLTAWGLGAAVLVIAAWLSTLQPIRNALSANPSDCLKAL